MKSPLKQMPLVHHRWQKAALLGSVWASVEIVLGSFLHNMKFPLTGTILSFAGISILIAGHTLWKEKGIVWRAGVICAVMKSVSPSSVIFGPMIGITLEAWIVEIAIRFIGGNSIGYILGGAIACTTPVIQKVISYLFTYGTNVAILFDKLVEFASKSLRIASIDSVDVIAIIIGLNLFSGGMASIVGMTIGKRARAFSNNQHQISANAPIYTPREFISTQRYSVQLLILHIVIITAGLIIQSVYFLLYIPFCFIQYAQLRERFQRWFFWFEIGVVSIAAGLVLGEFSLSDRTAGLIIGLQMFSRAIFVVSIFAAISIEFRNPLIINFFLRSHLKNLSVALEAAFGSLPFMIEQLQREKMFIRHPIDSMSKILAHAEQQMNLQNKESNIFVLTGEKDSGKTTLVEELSRKLKNDGYVIGGILQLKVMRNRERLGYDLFDIRTQKRIPLCRIDAPDKGITAGPFKFYPDAIQFGRDALSISVIKECEIAIIDEVGPLELQDSGWAESLSNILHSYQGKVFLVIRESSLQDVLTQFSIAPSAIWESGTVEIYSILRHIKTISKT